MRLIKVTVLLLSIAAFTCTQDTLEGFVKPSKQLGGEFDFSSVIIELTNKQGYVKESTNCAPTGYYAIPVKDKGSFTLRVKGPQGWDFYPISREVVVGRENEMHDFELRGFEIKGTTSSTNWKGETNTEGPAGIVVSLLKGDVEKLKTTTEKGGSYRFNSVLPGTYTLKFSHPTYKIEPSQTQITVGATGSYSAPQSVAISGYSIYGRILSHDEPMVGVNLYLYESKNRDVKNIGCKRTGDSLCSVKSDRDGNFVFEDVPIGTYKVVPFYEGFRIEPASQTITVTASANNSLKIPFKVLGFTVKGVVRNDLGQPVADVDVTVTQYDIEGRAVNVIEKKSDKNGEYVLEEITGDGTYRVEGKKEHYGFQTLERIKLVPSLPDIEPLIITQYEVCGQLKPDISQSPQLDQRTVIFLNLGDSLQSQQSTKTDENGNFCVMLSIPITEERKDKYEFIARVDIGGDGSRFAPRRFDLVRQPILDLELVQSLVEMNGHVQCVDQCDLTVELYRESTLIESVRTEADGGFKFSKKLSAGKYKIRAQDTNNEYCWEKQEQVIDVDETVAVDLVQKGYRVKITSTHDNFKLVGDQPITLHRGENIVCVNKTQTTWEVQSECWRTAQNKYTWKRGENIDIVVTDYLVKGTIRVEGNVNSSDFTILVKNYETSQETTVPVRTVAKNTLEYTVRVPLQSTLLITPISQHTLFLPRTHTYTGPTKHIQSCAPSIDEFVGREGVFKRGVTRGVGGVKIKVYDGDDFVTECVTDAEGRYIAGPLAPEGQYKLTAEKLGYNFVSVEGTNDFEAVELSSLTVRILDEAGNQVPDVFLSLSSSNQYRNNTVSADSETVFNNLYPGTYFLRVLLKEYSFTPASQSIVLKKGENVEIKIHGKRVAFSVIGTLSSLNGDPEQQLTVVATGIDDNSYEEGTSDAQGKYRLRGLKAGQKYEISVKPGGDVERSEPKSITVTMPKQDLTDTDFLTFRRTSITLTGEVNIESALLPQCFIELHRGTSVNTAKFAQKQQLLTNFFIFIVRLSNTTENYYLKLNCMLSSEYQMDRQDLVFVTNAKSTTKGSSAVSLGGIVTENQGTWHTVFSPTIRVKHQEQEINQTPFLALTFVVASFFVFIYRDRVIDLMNNVSNILLRNSDRKRK